LPSDTTSSGSQVASSARKPILVATTTTSRRDRVLRTDAPRRFHASQPKRARARVVGVAERLARAVGQAIGVEAVGDPGFPRACSRARQSRLVSTHCPELPLKLGRGAPKVPWVAGSKARAAIHPLTRAAARRHRSRTASASSATGNAFTWAQCGCIGRDPGARASPTGRRRG